jgi:hypothetical protein
MQLEYASHRKLNAYLDEQITDLMASLVLVQSETSTATLRGRIIELQKLKEIIHASQ